MDERRGVVMVWSNMYGKIPNEAFKRWNEVKDDSLHGMELFWGSKPIRSNLNSWNIIKQIGKLFKRYDDITEGHGIGYMST